MNKTVKKYQEGGGPVPPLSSKDAYYESSARLAYYKDMLNAKLKAKNPTAFSNYFKGLVDLRRAGNTQEAQKYVQEVPYNEYLSPQEVQGTLGDSYDDYMKSLQSVNTYNVQQGMQPLYGEIEGKQQDLRDLNYGRRFASLQITPSLSVTNETRGTNYNRQYKYNPESREVDFTEQGDLSLRPSYVRPPQPQREVAGLKKGGKIIKKYQNGTPEPIDPITGQKVFNPTGDLTGNIWDINPNQGPINPNTDPSQIIPLDQQQGSPVVQNETVPLSQFYEQYTGRGGNQGLRPTGEYVNAQGQTTTPQEQQSIGDQLSAQNRQTALGKQDSMRDIEMISQGSITAINAFLGRNNSAQQRRKNQRSEILRDQNALTLNPYAEGTGSQAIMKSGGKIHIKPENRGKFTAAAKRAGKSVQAYAAQILGNKDEYSPTLVKRANFARNASKWHEQGGKIEDDGGEIGINAIDGGRVKMISSSDHSSPMVEFQGKDHEEGGIGVEFGGTLSEVENKEIGWIDQEGSLNIFGKLKLPGTNQTFRKAAKDIADQESKIDRTKSKYINIINNSNPVNPYQQSAQSTAKVMFKSLDKQSKEIASKKESLTSYQDLILSMVDSGAKMKYGGKLPIPRRLKPTYADGGPIDPNDPSSVQKFIDEKSGGKSPLKAEDFIEISNKYGVPIDLMLAQAAQESNFGTKGRAVRTRNIFNVGNTDDGKEAFQDSWKAGLERYAKLIRDEYSSDPSNVNTQEILNRDFRRPGRGGRYATDPNYTKRIASILDEISPSNNYSYVNTSTVPGNSEDTPPASTRVPRLDITIPERVSVADVFKDFSPQYGQVPGVPQQAKSTPYGDAYRDSTPFSEKAQIGSGSRERDYQSPLAIEQIAPELLSIATNQQEPVTQLSYRPELQQTFDISYQLGRNQNQSTFNQAAQIAQQMGSVEALSQLAASKYQADQQYNMQEVQGNAQQRLQTYMGNINTLNDAQMKNLALTADQQVKQAQAQYNTRLQDMEAFKSISGKVAQNKLENRTYNAYANLFQNYGFDSKGNVTFDPDKVARKFNSGEARAFGMMAAQQGAASILNNGDFSRQFTRVKNPDGGTTTTETLGQSKQVIDKAKEYKAKGLPDMTINALLQAEFPENYK